MRNVRAQTPSLARSELPDPTWSPARNPLRIDGLLQGLSLSDQTRQRGDFEHGIGRGR